jgi:hypothetical protein
LCAESQGVESGASEAHGTIRLAADRISRTERFSAAPSS